MRLPRGRGRFPALRVLRVKEAKAKDREDPPSLPGRQPAKQNVPETCRGAGARALRGAGRALREHLGEQVATGARPTWEGGRA